MIKMTDEQQEESRFPDTASLADQIYGGLTTSLHTLIDNFGKTLVGNIKSNPDGLKKAISEKGPENFQMIEKILQPCETWATDYSQKVGKLEQDLQEAIEVSEQARADLEESKEQYQTDTQALNNRATEAEKKAENLVTKVNTIEEQQKSVTTELLESGKLVEMLNTQISSYTEGETKYQKQIEELKTTLQNAQHEYALLTKVLVNSLSEHVLRGESNYRKQKAEIEAIDENRERYDDVYLVEIGIVTGYSADERVASIQLIKELDKTLMLESNLLIKGPETELVQPVKSMEIGGNQVKEAGADVYLKLPVLNEVKENSIVYRMV